jgi:hypothetical protein
VSAYLKLMMSGHVFKSASLIGTRGEAKKARGDKNRKKMENSGLFAFLPLFTFFASAST